MSSWSTEPSWQPPPSGSAVSSQLIARVYALVLADTSIVGVVAVGSVVSALVFAGIAVPAWLLGGVDLMADTLDWRAWALYVVATWASAFVTVLFSGAVVAAGVARLEGSPITARAALGVAWSRRRQLCAWALVTTVVALLADQLNRFGLLGGILRLAADLAWSLATLLVLPIIIVEGQMPRAAIATSVGLIKGRLGLTIRTKIRLYLPWLAVMFVGVLVTAGGLYAFFHYRHDTPEWSLMGLLLAVVGVLATFVALSVQGAADALLNTVLYRHALGLPLAELDTHALPRLVTPPAPPAPPAAW
ncbi:MAG TPA: DUF6159 family protein [Nocardioides sp.]|jgi:hypothetical protein|nr:DUF6159 family protein [Nocardioides sp.]